MIEALNFIKNQAGVIPSWNELQEDQSCSDEFPFLDILSRAMNIQRVFEWWIKKTNNDKTSFMNELTLA